MVLTDDSDGGDGSMKLKAVVLSTDGWNFSSVCITQAILHWWLAVVVGSGGACY